MLIELVVVMAIFGILLSMAVPRYLLATCLPAAYQGLVKDQR